MNGLDFEGISKAVGSGNVLNMFEADTRDHVTEALGKFGDIINQEYTELLKEADKEGVDQAEKAQVSTTSGDIDKLDEEWAKVEPRIEKLRAESKNMSVEDLAKLKDDIAMPKKIEKLQADVLADNLKIGEAIEQVKAIEKESTELVEKVKPLGTMKGLEKSISTAAAMIASKIPGGAQGTIFKFVYRWLADIGRAFGLGTIIDKMIGKKGWEKEIVYGTLYYKTILNATYKDGKIPSTLIKGQLKSLDTLNIDYDSAIGQLITTYGELDSKGVPKKTFEQAMSEKDLEKDILKVASLIPLTAVVKCTSANQLFMTVLKHRKETKFEGLSNGVSSGAESADKTSLTIDAVSSIKEKLNANTNVSNLTISPAGTLTSTQWETGLSDLKEFSGRLTDITLNGFNLDDGESPTELGFAWLAGLNKLGNLKMGNLELAKDAVDGTAAAKSKTALKTKLGAILKSRPGEDFTLTLANKEAFKDPTDPSSAEVAGLKIVDNRNNSYTFTYKATA